MRNKQIKLIYFSLGGTELKQINLGWKRIVGVAAVSFAVLLLVVSLFIGVFTDILRSWQITHLSRTNQHLSSLVNEMGKRVQSIESKVTNIEKQDDDMRVFVDMPTIDKDVRKMGVGGQVNNLPTDISSNLVASSDEALKVKSMLDNFEQRLRLAAESRQEITKRYYEILSKLKQTPSIRPLWGGRVTDKFGYRLDPFIDRFAHHDGLDFSAPRGTDVYASADGVVIEVVVRYKPNQNYGKYVMIDHGYGRITRYAHMETVLVKPGQKVTRHTIIGKVGDTGKSTGPHLHYEVIVDGKPVDPEAFIMD
jgi:hypothetical protein